MREAVLELMLTLANSADAEDDCADQFASIATHAIETGDAILAAGMTTLARNHRIRALEHRGRLAAVSTEYGGVFHQDL